MKAVFKKIVGIVVVIALAVGIWKVGYPHIVKKLNPVEEKTTSNVDVVKEKLKDTAELNTGSYLCTAVITRASSKTFKEWTIPFTEKSFMVQYDGTVKAGIKDLTQATVEEGENTIIVTLPEVEITGMEIDNDSFEMLDEKNNVFNPISVEDLNLAQIDLKEEMRERAIKKGLLDIAKENAEKIVTGMFSGEDYEVQIKWK